MSRPPPSSNRPAPTLSLHCALPISLFHDLPLRSLTRSRHILFLGTDQGECGMDYVIVIFTAFAASGLTLYSGFGLGTVLLPAFALFFPVEDRKSTRLNSSH